MEIVPAASSQPPWDHLVQGSARCVLEYSRKVATSGGPHKLMYTWFPSGLCKLVPPPSPWCESLGMMASTQSPGPAPPAHRSSVREHRIQSTGVKTSKRPLRSRACWQLAHQKVWRVRTSILPGQSRRPAPWVGERWGGGEGSVLGAGSVTTGGENAVLPRGPSQPVPSVHWTNGTGSQ